MAAGRVVPEYQQEALRELICGNYRVIYEIIEGEVQILTLHHGARLLRGLSESRPRKSAP